MARLDKQRFTKKLGEILQEYSSKLAIQTRELANVALKYLNAGDTADSAIRKAFRETGFFIANNTAVVNTIYTAICAGYGILPEVLASPEGIKSKILQEPWLPDKIPLSERLHGTNKVIQQDILDTVQSSIRQQKSLTELARNLYTGYGYGTKSGRVSLRITDSGNILKEKTVTGKDTLNQSDLPEYLERLRSAAQKVSAGDREALRQFNQAVKQAAKQINLNAKYQSPNRALKASYLSVVDAAKELNDKAMDRAVRVAIEERTRYYAERIARTESARSYFEGTMVKHQNDSDVVGYRWLLSSRHAELPFDICDVYANADFGLGRGVFLKDKLPKIPVHPHCMCSVVPVFVDEMPDHARFDYRKADDYIQSLPEEHKKALLGVNGVRAYKGGTGAIDYAKGFNGFAKSKTRFDSTVFSVKDGLDSSGYISVDHEWAVKHFEKWYKQLSPEEIKAITMYQEHLWCNKINGYLRGRVSDEDLGGDLEIVLTTINQLDSAISKGIIKDNIQVYRGIKSRVLNELWDNFKSLNEENILSYRDLAYSSTSVSEDVSKLYAWGKDNSKDGILTVVQIPKDTCASYAEVVNGINEYEILLPRDSKFILLDVWIDSNGRKRALLKYKGGES